MGLKDVRENVYLWVNNYTVALSSSYDYFCYLAAEAPRGPDQSNRKYNWVFWDCAANLDFCSHDILGVQQLGSKLNM